MRVFYIAHAEHVPGVDEPPENVSFKPFERSRQLAWFEKVVLFSNKAQSSQPEVHAKE
jgi:hypothetical protein